MAEWEQVRFGLPEPFSEGLLYGGLERELVRRADQALRKQRPYHAPATDRAA